MERLPLAFEYRRSSDTPKCLHNLQAFSILTQTVAISTISELTQTWSNAAHLAQIHTLLPARKAQRRTDMGNNEPGITNVGAKDFENIFVHAANDVHSCANLNNGGCSFCCFGGLATWGCGYTFGSLIRLMAPSSSSSASFLLTSNSVPKKAFGEGLGRHAGRDEQMKE
eukprot:1482294-Amphidinium_carterae.1